MVVELDERYDYGEDRLIGTGMLDGRVVVLIYTEPNEGTTRIISLRKALSHEKKRYEQYLKTDWARIDAMSDEDIDTSDIPPLTDEFLQTPSCGCLRLP